MQTENLIGKADVAQGLQDLIASLQGRIETQACRV